MITRIYVAGPMTGLPEFNYPAFRTAAAGLRAFGYDVEDPSVNGERVKADPTWTDYMRLGLTQLLTCDGVALLPGWQRSQGARLEVLVATALNLVVRDVANWLSGQEAA